MAESSGADPAAAAVVRPNWTTSRTGHSNSSPRYIKVAQAIARVLRAERSDLQRGEYGNVARIVASDLAHGDEQMVPRDTLLAEVTEVRTHSTGLAGTLVHKGQTYRFYAVPPAADESAGSESTGARSGFSSPHPGDLITLGEGPSPATP